MVNAIGDLRSHTAVDVSGTVFGSTLGCHRMTNIIHGKAANSKIRLEWHRRREQFIPVVYHIST